MTKISTIIQKNLVGIDLELSKTSFKTNNEIIESEFFPVEFLLRGYSHFFENFGLKKNFSENFFYRNFENSVVN